MMVICNGYMPQDLVYGETASGKKKVAFAVAQKSGKERIWVNCWIIGDHLDPLLPYIKKGSNLMVTGRLATPRTYMSRAGQPCVDLSVFVKDITLLPASGKKPVSQTLEEQQRDQQDDRNDQERTETSNEKSPVAFVDEDLPF